MSGWNNWGIRRKLFSIILLILVANVVVLLLMGSTLFERFYQHSKVAELEASAKAIRAAYEQNSETIYEEISQIENENAIVSLLSIGENDKMLLKYHSRALKWDTHPWGDRPDMPKPKMQEIQRYEEGMLERLRNTDETFNVQNERGGSKKDNSWGEFLSLSVRLDDNLYLFMETPRGYLKSTAEMAVKYTALVSIGLLVAGAVVIYFLVARVTRPIQSIQRAANKISRLDFSETCEAKGGDEIASLAGSINGMSRELQASVEKLVEANRVLQNDLVRQQQTDRMRQQFIANVSHDFKTPLTLMISYAEALSERGRLAEEEREYCDTIIGEGNKLSEMVGKMLSLSKLESGVDQPAYSIFCLSEVVDEVLRSHSILTGKRGLVIERRMEDAFIVNADYQKITQVVINLFENAVKYAPDGGRILVTARRNGQSCRVAIENTGELIEEEDLGSLFESFYRADKSRTAGDSYGLGLAIVRVVMEAHGQPYGVENTETGVRFWFELSLPEMDDEPDDEDDASE